MRLKKLELQGFKSFLDKTILSFEPGITGVVGPNGCGKSNIVDAIQWVMGEQSAKHLRGESMTDVIFNGSDSRPATSLAEVTLVLDRQGVPIAPEFSAFDKSDDISVTRRVFRDGNSEYLINKTVCRLKDIHELFMDTGVGKRAYSIIEQGQIDRMISVKPEDRRVIFEEVAGITKYKSKRREAEKKLELTRQNLVRLDDIIRELEKQIRSLKIQATRARKYKETKSEMEIVDLYLLGRKLFDREIEIKALEKQKDELALRRTGIDAKLGEIEASLTQVEVSRIDKEHALRALGDRERELSLIIQKIEGGIALYEEKQKNLEKSLDENIQEEQSIDTSLVGLEGELAQFRNDEKMLREREAILKSATINKNAAVVEKDALLRQANDSLRSRQDKKTTLLQSIGTTEAETGHLEARIVELVTLHNKALLTEETSYEQMQVLAEQAKRIDEKIQASLAQTNRAAEEVESISRDLQEISARLTDVEEALYEKRKHFLAVKSKYDSLQELQVNLEGYCPTAREILSSMRERFPATPLAELLVPDADIEEHLEVLLGQDMNTLVVQTVAEADELSRIIQERMLERVNIIALDAVRVPVVRNDLRDLPSIVTKIRIRPEFGRFEKLVEWRFNNTFLCETHEELLRLRHEHADSVLVSRDTKAVATGSVIIGCGTATSKSGVFQRRREIEELSRACGILDVEVARLSTERENLLQYLQAQEKTHSDVKDRLSKLHIESVTYRKEHERVLFELSRAEQDKLRATNDAEKCMETKNNMQLALSQSRERLSRYHETLSNIVKELSLGHEEKAHIESELSRLSLEQSELKVELTSLYERQSLLNYKISSVTQSKANFEQRKGALALEREESKVDISMIEQGIEQSKVREESERQKYKTLLVDITDHKQEFDMLCTQIQDFREALGIIQKDRNTVIDESQEVELKIVDRHSSLEQLKNLSMERYQKEPDRSDGSCVPGPEKLPLLSESLETGWNEMSPPDQERYLEEHLKNLRDKIARYGEVNLTAIHEFDEIQGRFDFINTQKADLEKSIRVLEEAIKKIDETTKTRFEDTFNAVNAKFKEIFPVLFTGGHAELELVNVNGNVLDSGVDIMVHPPGKKPMSISLLSGGEKALTAVSLVLAIFALKPSPFCLLDEVDAPLDDANVSRFNTVIRKMAEKTQFIVITHNKKTMEAAEALYGVTMERSGVSKMTSVRLN